MIRMGPQKLNTKQGKTLNSNSTVFITIIEYKYFSFFFSQKQISHSEKSQFYTY